MYPAHDESNPISQANKKSQPMNIIVGFSSRHLVPIKAMSKTNSL